MKGHERDPRWSRRRRDTCILWSLGLSALGRRRDGRVNGVGVRNLISTQVTRALCGRKTSKELVAEYGTDGYLSRHQAQTMFEELDVGASRDLATRLLGANQRASAADLDRLFRVPSTADLHERVSLRGSIPAHR